MQKETVLSRKNILHNNFFFFQKTFYPNSLFSLMKYLFVKLYEFAYFKYLIHYPKNIVHKFYYFKIYTLYNTLSIFLELFFCFVPKSITFKRSVLLDIKYHTESDIEVSVVNRVNATAVARRIIARSIPQTASTKHTVLTTSCII